MSSSPTPQTAVGPSKHKRLAVLLSDSEIPIRDHVVLAPRFKSNLALRKGKWIYISGQGDSGFAGDRGGPKAVALSKRKNSDIARSLGKSVQQIQERDYLLIFACGKPPPPLPSKEHLELIPQIRIITTQKIRRALKNQREGIVFS